MTYAPPTETNPPFSSPAVWPFPTTSERWETDYRLRLLEYALTYMWTNPNAANPLTYGADPLGILDSTSAFQQTMTAATTGPNPPWKIFMPAGTFNISGGWPSPAQGNGWIDIVGAGKEATTLRSMHLGVDIVNLSMPGRLADFTVDLNGYSGNGIFCHAGFVGNKTIVGTASGNVNTLTVTLSSTPNPLPPVGTPIPLTVAFVTAAQTPPPAFTGYAIFNNVGNVFTLIANQNYPNGLTATIAASDVTWGTSAFTIDQWILERVRCMNAGQSSGGRPITISDSSVGYPFLIQRLTLRDVTVGPSFSTVQEQCNVTGVGNISVENFVGDNTLPGCQTTAATGVAPISTISCTPLPVHIPNDKTGGLIQVALIDPTGVNKQLFTIAADAPQFSTTLNITTATPAFNFPAGSTVICAQGRTHLNLFRQDQVTAKGIRLKLGMGNGPSAFSLSWTFTPNCTAWIAGLKIENLTNDCQNTIFNGTHVTCVGWDFSLAPLAFPNCGGQVGGGAYHFYGCKMSGGINANGSPAMSNFSGPNIGSEVFVSDSFVGPYPPGGRGCYNTTGGNVPSIWNIDNTDSSNPAGPIFFGGTAANNCELHMHGGSVVYLTSAPIANQIPVANSDIGTDVKGYAPMAHTGNYTLKGYDTGLPVVFNLAVASVATLPSAVVVGPGGPVYAICNGNTSIANLTINSVAGTVANPGPIGTGVVVKFVSDGTNWNAA